MQHAVIMTDGAWFVEGAVTAKCAEMELSGSEWCDVGVGVGMGAWCAVVCCGVVWW